MSEFLIKINSNGIDPLYQDGDIVCAMNKNRIEWCHLDTICDVKKETFNSDGLNPILCIADYYQSKRYEFKLERINANQLKKIKLSDLSEEVIGPFPNSKGEAINIPLFLWGKNGRLRNKNHRIFGTKGKEYWYGGNTDFSNSTADLIWAEVETRSKGLRNDSQKWPFTIDEMKDFLIVPCDDFTNLERSDYEGSIKNLTNPEKLIIIKMRKFKIDWRNLSGVSPQTITKILDKNIPMDFRKFPNQSRAAICIEKT